jgi:O-antigen/teichoic acid export membrane protein
MSTASRIARNTSYLLLARVATVAIGIVTSVLTARYLGASGFGVLGFALAFTAIFGILVDFGLGMLTTREVARDRALASKYLANIVAIRLFLGAAFVALVALLVNVLTYSPQTIYVTLIIALSVVINTVGGTLASLFQAFQKMQPMAVGLVLNSVLTLLGISSAIMLHLSVVAFAYVYVIANAITLAYYCVAYRAQFRLQRPEIDWAFWKRTLREGWPMAALSISVMVYFRIDVVILSLFRGAAQIGLYTVAYTISETSTIIPTMFMASLFPLISQMHQDSKRSFADTCAKSVKYMLYIGLPMAFTVTLWATPVITLFYGNAFAGSAVALQIIIWSAAAMYVGIILGNTFVSANLQKLSMKLTISAMAFNIILNLLVIPTYGYWGASATTVATETFIVCTSIFFLERYGYPLHMRLTIGPPFFGLGVIAAISAVLLTFGVPLVLITVIALTVYAAILWKLGLDDEDKQLIQNLLKYPRLAAPGT